MRYHLEVYLPGWSWRILSSSGGVTSIHGEAPDESIVVIQLAGVKLVASYLKKGDTPINRITLIDTDINTPEFSMQLIIDKVKKMYN